MPRTTEDGEPIADERPSTVQRSDAGVDEEASKAHLYERAQELDVGGRSTMTEAELVEALQKANDRATRG